MKLNRVSAVIAGGLLIVGTAAQATAGYVNNGDQWARMSPIQKAAYAQGLNDTANFVFTNDDLSTGIVKAARTRCLIDMKMAPNILSDMISSAYDKTPQLKNQPPLYFYIARLSDICRPIINQERARFNLPPQ